MTQSGDFDQGRQTDYLETLAPNAPELYDTVALEALTRIDRTRIPPNDPPRFQQGS